MGSLDGKLIAITGASRGLGRQLARRCIDAGARVAVVARASEVLDEAMQALGDGAFALPTDIRSVESVDESFGRLAREHGRLDALVNNAAYYYPTLLSGPPERIEEHFATNVLGATWCMRAAAPLLRAAGGGDIVNISSVSVRVAPPMLAFYAASKAALETLSAALAAELQPDGVRVTVLRLGAVAGGTAGGGWDEESRTAFLKAIAAAPRVGGAPVSQDTLANVLLSVLTLPREARLNLIDVSPAA